MRKTGYRTKAFLSYLQRDERLWLCIVIAAVLGLFASALYAFLMKESACEELHLYLQDFFKNISQSGTDGGALFKTALRTNGTNCIFLLLSSLMVIGAPLVVGFAAIRCFMHGFTLFLLLRLYGVRALLFFILGMLPHYLLLVPAYGLLCVLCLRFTLTLMHDKGDLKRRLFLFLGKTLGLFAVTLMAALLQAYVEPFLIGLVAELYM